MPLTVVIVPDPDIMVEVDCTVEFSGVGDEDLPVAVENGPKEELDGEGPGGDGYVAEKLDEVLEAGTCVDSKELIVVVTVERKLEDSSGDFPDVKAVEDVSLAAVLVVGELQGAMLEPESETDDAVLVAKDEEPEVLGPWVVVDGDETPD